MVRFHRLVLCVELLLCLYTAGAVNVDGGFTKEDFPDPRYNYTACGQIKASHVCDPGQTLKKREVHELNDVIEIILNSTYEHNSSCKPGTPRHQVMVAIVPWIKDSEGGNITTNKTYEQLIKEFAEYLRDKGWRVSDPTGCAVHVIIVIDVNTTTMWTATNTFVREVITEQQIKQTWLEVRDEYFMMENVFGRLRLIVNKYRLFLGLYFINGYAEWLITIHLVGVYWQVNGYLYKESVWRVSVVIVLVVVGTVVLNTVRLVLATAAVGAVMAAAVVKAFRSVIEPLMSALLRTTAVIVIGVVLLMAVNTLVPLVSPADKLNVFGEPVEMALWVAMILMSSVGIGVYGAAVVEVWRPGTLVTEIVVVGTAVVAACGAAWIFQVVLHVHLMKTWVSFLLGIGFLICTGVLLTTIFVPWLICAMMIEGRNLQTLKDAKKIFLGLVIITYVFVWIPVMIPVLGEALLDVYGTYKAVIALVVLSTTLALSVITMCANWKEHPDVMGPGAVQQAGAVRDVMISLAFLMMIPVVLLLIYGIDGLVYAPVDTIWWIVIIMLASTAIYHLYRKLPPNFWDHINRYINRFRDRYIYFQ